MQTVTNLGIGYKPLTDHQTYLLHSNLYKALFTMYGSALSAVVASQWANAHETTLELLAEDGLSWKPSYLTVSTLDFVMALGY